MARALRLEFEDAIYHLIGRARLGNCLAGLIMPRSRNVSAGSMKRTHQD